uniref:Uncharacterized protein n=1 Tax=Romanomermis culicivorax TaxID=13658 RepID=A0A915J741_ROMCU
MVCKLANFCNLVESFLSLLSVKKSKRLTIPEPEHGGSRITIWISNRKCYLPFVFDQSGNFFVEKDGSEKTYVASTFENQIPERIPFTFNFG